MSGWRNNIVVSSLEASVGTIKKGWSKVLIALAIDSVFLVVFGAVLAFFQFQVNKLLMEIESFLTSGPNVSGELLSNSNVGSILQQQQAFSDLSSQLIKWTIAFFIVMYFVYSIIQSGAWVSIYNIDGKRKMGYWSYLSEFAYVNLFWLLVSSLLVWFGIRITLFNKLSLFPVIEDSTGVTLVITTIVVAAYFMLISYSVIGVKNWKRLLPDGLKLGFKKFYAFFLVDVVFVAVVVALGYILKWASTISFGFMMVLGIVLFMPTLSWLRILHLELVKRFEKK